LFTREVVMIRVSRIVSGFIFFLAVLTMWGQSFSGRIVGLVTDSSSAVLPTVAVSVVNEGTGAQRRLSTDASGIYVVAELPVGYYAVRFETPGLSTVERQRVKVDVGGETRVDVSLAVQTVAQSFDVNAEAPVLQRDSSASAEVVDTRQAEELPLNA
jgi:hypothetical protein